MRWISHTSIIFGPRFSERTSCTTAPVTETAVEAPITSTVLPQQMLIPIAALSNPGGTAWSAGRKSIPPATSRSLKTGYVTADNSGRTLWRPEPIAARRDRATQENVNADATDDPWYAQRDARLGRVVRRNYDPARR